MAASSFLNSPSKTIAASGFVSVSPSVIMRSDFIWGIASGAASISSVGTRAMLTSRPLFASSIRFLLILPKFSGSGSDSPA